MKLNKNSILLELQNTFHDDEFMTEKKQAIR